MRSHAGLLVALLLGWHSASSAQDPVELTRQGRQAWERRDAEGTRDAIRLFGRAIELDSGYAPAWSGLADAYSLIGEYEAARDPARWALELDPELGEAHASLGFVLLQADWDWQLAERHLRSAVALAPEHAAGRLWLAIALEVTGRHDEAVAQVRAVVERPPTSPRALLHLGYRLYWARRYPQALEVLERVLEAEPDLSPAHYFIGRARTEQGDYAMALEAFTRAGELDPHNRNIDAAVGHLQARRGRPEEARRRLHRLESLAARGLPFSTQNAAILIALGERQSALSWLERAYRRREGPLIWLAVDPRFDDLRDERRLRSILRRMGLERTTPSGSTR